MNEAFRNTCVLLNKKLNELNKLLTNLKEQIIIKDLSFELDRTVLAGRKLVAGLQWIDETDVNGETFTLIDKSKQKILWLCSFVGKRISYCWLRVHVQK